MGQKRSMKPESMATPASGKAPLSNTIRNNCSPVVLTHAERVSKTPLPQKEFLKGTDAGWSSPVARWAHNPKVAGSNPVPATNIRKPLVMITDRARAFPFLGSGPESCVPSLKSRGRVRALVSCLRGSPPRISVTGH